MIFVLGWKVFINELVLLVHGFFEIERPCLKRVTGYSHTGPGAFLLKHTRCANPLLPRFLQAGKKLFPPACATTAGWCPAQRFPFFSTHCSICCRSRSLHRFCSRPAGIQHPKTSRSVSLFLWLFYPLAKVNLVCPLFYLF